MVNIREFSAEELRSVIEKSIDLLSQEEVVAPVEPAKEEEWQNEDGHILTLISEDDMWNVRWCKLRRYIQLLSRSCGIP